MTPPRFESRSIAYRPDIDGLRAIAVLMVLLFHCDFDDFAGGYIGVDVFFVISGFLITSLILADLRSGTFSFARFFVRRVRRLLPALLATIVLTIGVATLIMGPENLVDAATSGGLAAVSLSNFYFSKAASYFDASANTKPFLHMWSLSLEEQFYLFWPLTVLLAYRWKREWAVTVLIAGAIPFGVALSEYWVDRNVKQAYFLLPFRGYQFLLGAACIGLSRVRISRVPGTVLGLCGLSLIGFSATVFSDQTPFPGLAALVPSLGAMLVIWQGQQIGMQRLIGNRPAVWFGRISYSTYLIHWPIIVFWSYLSIESLSTTNKVALFMLSIVGGQILHSLVEQRFRYQRGEDPRSTPKFLMGVVGVVAALGIFCSVVLSTDGLPRRLSLTPEVAHYRNQSLFPFLRDYRDGILHLASAGSTRVLIFGDSMAQNYIPALLDIDGIREAEVDIVSRGGCVLAKGAVLVNSGSPDQYCTELRDHLYQVAGSYDVVVWAQNWLGYDGSLHWENGPELQRAFTAAANIDGWRDGIDRTLDHFESRSKAIVVIGPPVTVRNVNPVLSHIGPITNISEIPTQFPMMREISTRERDALNGGLRDLVATRRNTLYIDPRAVVCGHADRCELWGGKYSYYMDSLHNTAAATPMLRAGLERVGLAMFLSGIANDIVNEPPVEK